MRKGGSSESAPGRGGRLRRGGIFYERHDVVGRVCRLASIAICRGSGSQPLRCTENWPDGCLFSDGSDGRREDRQQWRRWTRIWRCAEIAAWKLVLARRPRSCKQKTARSMLPDVGMTLICADNPKSKAAGIVLIISTWPWVIIFTSRENRTGIVVFILLITSLPALHMLYVQDDAWPAISILLRRLHVETCACVVAVS